MRELIKLTDRDNSSQNTYVNFFEIAGFENINQSIGRSYKQFTRIYLRSSNSVIAVKETPEEIIKKINEWLES